MSLFTPERKGGEKFFEKKKKKKVLVGFDLPVRF